MGHHNIVWIPKPMPSSHAKIENVPLKHRLEAL